MGRASDFEKMMSQVFMSYMDNVDEECERLRREQEAMLAAMKAGRQIFDVPDMNKSQEPPQPQSQEQTSVSSPVSSSNEDSRELHIHVHTH